MYLKYFKIYILAILMCEVSKICLVMFVVHSNIQYNLTICKKRQAESSIYIFLILISIEQLTTSIVHPDEVLQNGQPAPILLQHRRGRVDLAGHTYHPGSRFLPAQCSDAPGLGRKIG